MTDYVSGCTYCSSRWFRSTGVTSSVLAEYSDNGKRMEPWFCSNACMSMCKHERNIVQLPHELYNDTLKKCFPRKWNKMNGITKNRRERRDPDEDHIVGDELADD